MSGGHFDYVQTRMFGTTFDLQDAIRDSEYKKETTRRFKDGLTALRLATIYIERIDMLLSGDDSEENFHIRLTEDLEKFHADMDNEG